ncbi:FGGY carbohydrate kinase domain-containing protein [Orussus abietinus]|uniref:FGGY carbohydrate kinase domain-containing protein n=1 Tax=Orussus abietinus TaxID=222816 RepID=UPI000626CEB7|nr:FGGY carbohydrate kinase domain-containing protein [Orussus abietinus]
MDYYIGVDVGTGSARAALVSLEGKIKKTAVHSIKTFISSSVFYEQSSNDIWEAVCQTVKIVTENVPKDNVKGIGFAATCSLVALDENGLPVTVSLSGKDEQNIILWLDHRAEEEANFINKSNHKILRYVGGKISLEMETPKMLWLKNNLPKSWARAQLLFDLPDFLTWRATDAESRSLCSLVCKWNYCADPSDNNGWNIEFFESIGLSDLSKSNWRRIGNKVQTPGDCVGSGLSATAAAELGLRKGTPVATSMIDAHAGGLGLVGCSVPGISNDFSTRLGLICGTSTCHMIVNEKEIYVDGVWGPYYSAMVPRMWLNEGGQSATGKLLDHIIDTHPAIGAIRHKINGKMHVQQYLSEILQAIAKQKNLPDVSYLTNNLHVWPDFHGNRSPLADPGLQGMISGLTLSADEESLALLYLATVQALTYGTKHILEALTLAGHKVETLLICGGLSQNPLFTQIQADVLGLPVLTPLETESVLLGAAILGSYAAGVFPSVNDAVRSMGGLAKIVKPNKAVYKYHQRKYQVFKKMVQDQKTYKELMEIET